MNFEYTDGGQTWHLFVDDAGEVHDEPLEEPTPPAAQPVEDQA